MIKIKAIDLIINKNIVFKYENKLKTSLKSILSPFFILLPSKKSEKKKL